MAKLESVVVRNFRNITIKELTNLEIKNVITGKNMSGKTNTLNAIHWAFTGVTLDGSADNRANFPIDGETKTTVELDFGDFKFARVCEMVDDTPSVSIYVDGEKATTIKNGEARLHAKLGLTDIILTQPKDFNIVRFLLNPLYFDTISPSALRKFMYMMADILDFREIAEQQNKSVLATIEKYGEYDPYKLADLIAKKKKGVKADIKTCKDARILFPSIESESTKLEKEKAKDLKVIENDEALVDKYALGVSKRANAYYQKAMGLKVCLLEKGVGDDVYKDVCYPILPKSGLPFALGSYAERSLVGMLFIREMCLKYNIKPLPILLDNMESLDERSLKQVDDMNAQIIGALVK